MRYADIHEAVFCARPNRFIAHVEVGGKPEIAHVKNTGRCKELLVSGAKAIVQKAGNPARKTAYDLIAVWKGSRLVNVDSQAPNQVFLEHLRAGRYMKGITRIQPEAKYGGSRFDFYVEAGERKAYRKIFIEVKGVTLEDEGMALFPDAPTERGLKHVNELAQCLREGYEAHIVFVIQMSDVRCFTPNSRMHPAFGEALVAAKAAGVEVVALDCIVTANSLTIGKGVPVEFNIGGRNT